MVPVLDHPPYSPDLSPPDYFLFPKLKMKLKDDHFITIETIQEAVTEKFKNIPETGFSWAMEKLGDRTKSCIDIVMVITLINVDKRDTERARKGKNLYPNDYSNYN